MLIQGLRLFPNSFFPILEISRSREKGNVLFPHSGSPTDCHCLLYSMPSIKRNSITVLGFASSEQFSTGAREGQQCSSTRRECRQIQAIAGRSAYRMPILIVDNNNICEFGMVAEELKCISYQQSNVSDALAVRIC